MLTLYKFLTKYNVSAYKPLSPIVQPEHKNTSISTFSSLQSCINLVSTLTFFTLKFNLYMYSTLYSTSTSFELRKCISVYIYSILYQHVHLLNLKLNLYIHSSWTSNCTSLCVYLFIPLIMYQVVLLSCKSDRKNSCFVLHQFEQTVFTKTFESNRPIGPEVCQNIVAPQKIYWPPYIYVIMMCNIKQLTRTL